MRVYCAHEYTQSNARFALTVEIDNQQLKARSSAIDAARAKDHGRALHVCHVLRYTPFFQAVRHVVQSGRLGRIVTVEHRENVESLHMAHSYVRGAYGRTD